MGIYLFVTPKQSNVECNIEFRMKHDYVYTTIPTSLNPNESNEQTQPTKETKWITHTIKVNLGYINDG